MNLYEILQVSPDSSINDIKKSYYRLAKIYHPDKMNGSAEKFQKINYAYNILNNEKSRTQYNIMNNNTKNKFILFLEKWFKDQPNLKSFFNFNDNIYNNLDSYDFNDIIMLFSDSIIPNKVNIDSVDCSDSDIDCWDESQAEYYYELPIKYHQYNKNNINLELKCTLNEIICDSSTNTKSKTRMIKIRACYIK